MAGVLAGRTDVLNTTTDRLQLVSFKRGNLNSLSTPNTSGLSGNPMRTSGSGSTKTTAIDVKKDTKETGVKQWWE